jgi:hypothetical protein
LQLELDQLGISDPAVSNDFSGNVERRRPSAAGWRGGRPNRNRFCSNRMRRQKAVEQTNTVVVETSNPAADTTEMLCRQIKILQDNKLPLIEELMAKT